MEKENPLAKQISEEIHNFNTKSIVVVDGFEFNQRETIEKIYRYYNSKFENGDVDNEGDKKYFYNIVRNPCKVTTKAIDFDTKHISIQSSSSGSPRITWLFERDLKFWMKDQGFGEVLNRIFREIPIFGSVVLKVIKGKPYFVDLRNFIVEQDADDLNNSNYIIERHNYTPLEFKKEAEKFGWGNADEIIDAFKKGKSRFITVYERYGDIENEGKFIYKRVYFADIKEGLSGLISPFDKAPSASTYILKEEEVKEHPYWEFHLEKIAGRWLGVGVVETIFDPQIRINELSNQQAKGTYWASLRLFQTTDPGVNKNLQTDVVNGQVLTSDAPITPVEMQDRNLSYFTQQILQWIRSRDENTFAYDVVQGERLPAGTPLGSAKLAANMALSYFDQLREDIAMRIKAFLYEEVLPNFESWASQEHYLRLVGEDFQTFEEWNKAKNLADNLVDFLAKNKVLPTYTQYEAIKLTGEFQKSKAKEAVKIIPKNLYKNIKYQIDIIITGESKDATLMAQLYFSALQAITADPTLLIDPRKKKIFYKIMENNGINPMDLEPDVQNPMLEEMSMMGQGRVGGGVSAPIAVPKSVESEMRV